MTEEATVRADQARVKVGKDSAVIDIKVFVSEIHSFSFLKTHFASRLRT